MTCEVCQHCQESVSRAEGYAVRAGYSYHNKCHKCYVCSETDLHNAEVFKGVIFCSSCSQRIFQGCSTARRTKSGEKSRRGRSRSKSKSIRRSRSPCTERGRAKNPIPTGVIELAHLAAAASRSSEAQPVDSTDSSKKLEITTELALQVGKRIYGEPLTENATWDTIKKDSAEIGVTTNVTQDLLRQMKCPVIETWERKLKSAIPKRKQAKIIPKPSPSPRNTKCSDWRIAELGQSTEIANMVLKKKSELPVIIRSLNQLKKDMSSHPSCLNRESDESGDSNEDWMGSSYGKDSERGMAMKDMHVGRFLKIPIKCFKRNILQRSSLIDVMIKSDDKKMILNRFRNIFREEITGHQRRGIRRLFSTINRRQTPYKMGWPHIMSKVSGVRRMKHPNNDGCKHFKRSHSYRCMRALVMRNAGPTKSELAVFRSKLKNIIVPHCFRNGFNFVLRATRALKESVALLEVLVKDG